MGSPNTYSQGPMPPPPRYRRSIAGPLVLIIIGLLFLLRNFGFRFPIWHWFGRWWPLLLILWGVIALVEHISAQRMGYRTRHLGAAGIVLLVILVAVGVSAHYSSDINWNGVRDQMEMNDDLGGIFGTSYTFDDSLEQAFPPHGSLRIVCDHGTLTISPSNDKTLRVVVHKKLVAPNQNDANKYNEGTKPQVTVTGNVVLLNANTNGAGEHGVQVDLDIFVPGDAPVDVASKQGDVTINGRKAEVKIALQHGDVSLTDIGGDAKIALEKGSLRTSKIAGNLDVAGRLDSVDIDDVSGQVNLAGDFFEDIRLSKIGKGVNFKSSRSDMQIAAVPGEIEIASDEVRGSDLVGPSRLTTGSKDIHMENVSGDFQLQTSNGDVEFRAADKLPLGRISITSQHGDVSLVLPSNAGFQVQATTSKGDITSDFANVKVNEGNGSSSASGSVGNAAGKVQISTDTGDIRISKS